MDVTVYSTFTGGCAFLEHIYEWVWQFRATLWVCRLGLGGCDWVWVGVTGCGWVGKMIKLFNKCLLLSRKFYLTTAVFWTIYYKDELSVAASSRNHVIGLSKTRWVERYKAHENYYFFEFIVAMCDSIYNPHLYEEFYKYLEN